MNRFLVNPFPDAFMFLGYYSFPDFVIAIDNLFCHSISFKQAANFDELELLN